MAILHRSAVDRDHARTSACDVIRASLGLSRAPHNAGSGPPPDRRYAHPPCLSVKYSQRMLRALRAFSLSATALRPRNTLFTTSYRTNYSTNNSNSEMATHTVQLPASDIPDGGMKEVDFGAEDQKVLVSRIGDKVFATSAFCTHYGAPLAKGVLAANGRVTCPWHSACFDVRTGDIEDGPGRDALHCFRAVLSPSDGTITITAPIEKTKKANKARTPFLRSKYNAKAAAADGNGVVIVGGGSGGLSVAESLREHGYAGKVTLLSKEDYAPIDRTKLSKALLTDLSQLEWRPASVLKDTFGIDLRTGVTVTAVNTAEKTVTTDSGDVVAYDKLVLAPGAIPRRLPVEGADLEGVCVLRGVDDAKKLQGLKSKGKHIVVIGSSFISMELVAFAMKQGPASIDVIGMETVPFERVLGKEIGGALMKFFESNGVKFHMGASVTRLEGSPTLVGHLTGAQSVSSVVIDGSTTLPADIVIMGVGVRPATDFLQGNASFKLEKDGGLEVDDDLSVPGVQDVFAVGDIAHFPQHGQGGGKRRVEHWNVATDHGRAVGATIAGTEKPYSRVPVFWSALGQQLRYCGTSNAAPDEVIVQGNPEELKFLAYYVSKGEVVAVASMQNDPVVMKCAELLRHDIMPSPAELKAGKNPLDIDISSSKSEKITAGDV